MLRPFGPDEVKGMLRERRHRGFTIIEIMVVVVIIGLLATLVIPRVIGRGDEAKRTAAQVQIKEVEQALDLYHLDNGFYPTQDQGLDALVTRPNLPPEPQNYRTGGYLKKVPKDPWGREFIYRMPGDHGEYDLLSYGPDGQEGGEEKNKDINNWD